VKLGDRIVAAGFSCNWN